MTPSGPFAALPEHSPIVLVLREYARRSIVTDCNADQPCRATSIWDHPGRQQCPKDGGCPAKFLANLRCVIVANYSCE
jgi:hypothetical protein